jgi:hypothetical protein
VCSETVRTAFFVVDVKGRYNVLLGQDWIHTNDCVPSTLHQCVIQWVRDEVEIVCVDSTACVTMAEAGDGWQDSDVKCLIGRDLVESDYVSVGKDSFVPVNVKPMGAIRLENMES